ncbi:thiol reductant ABC exporter subunit CydC [Halomonas denitrificans]|uniref:thiol reductant ABC exporter subunit CydC n=1 Tax=Halomonas denitrificans TaxID=370769 RepID=UPI001C993BB9|nr:thiol reductant ABC exporter subunit CydC [Halomonas denitrificans]MBY5970536.1 thiol reductant ABC exporter subunit CydC [Halomonas denitrificans]
MSSQQPSMLAHWHTLKGWLALHDELRGRLLVGLALMVLTALSALGLLAVSGWFITASALTGVALAAGVAAALDVYTPGAGIRLFAVSRTVSRYVERLYNHDTILRLLAKLRARCFAGLVAMDGRRLATARASDWLNRLTADIDTLDALYLRLLAPAGMALMLCLAVVGLVAIWLPEAALALSALLLLGWCWLTLGQARAGMQACRQRMVALERLRGAMIESVTGMCELEAYRALDRRRQQLEALEDDVLKAQWRLSVVTAWGNAVSVMVMGAAWWWLLVSGLLAFQGGQMSAPVLVMLPLAALALAEGLASLPAAFSHAGASLVAAERLNQIESTATPPAEADTDARQTAADHATSGSGGPAGVAFDALAFRYPAALDDALAPVSGRVDPGERVSLCGASGAGKSTLLALLAGELTGYRGRLTLDGIDLAQWPRKALAQRVGCLTQRVELFDTSLAENLRIGRPDASDEALWQALEAVDLADWAETLPRQLDTRVGEGGRQVSGGQARRLGLARLWLTDPGLVILDEPFAALDAATASRVARGIEPWLSQRTVLMLVHHHDPRDPAPGMQAVGRVIPLEAATAWRKTRQSGTMDLM